MSTALVTAPARVASGWHRLEATVLDSAAYEEVCGVFVIADGRTTARLTRTYGYPWFWSATEYRTDVYVLEPSGRIAGALTLERPARLGENVVLHLDDVLDFLGIERPFHGMCYVASRPWDGSAWTTPWGYQDIYLELIGRGGYAAGILNTIAPLNHAGVTKHHGVKMAAPKLVLSDDGDAYFIMINHSSDAGYRRALGGQLALCAPDGQRTAWVEGPVIPPFGCAMLDLKTVFPDWRRFTDASGRATLYFSVPPGGVLIPYVYLHNRASGSWAIEHTRPPRHYVLGYIPYKSVPSHPLRKALQDAVTLLGYRAGDSLEGLRRRLPQPVRRALRGVRRRLRQGRSAR
jgi:hypothetical protein